MDDLRAFRMRSRDHREGRRSWKQVTLDSLPCLGKVSADKWVTVINYEPQRTFTHSVSQQPETVLPLPYPPRPHCRSEALDRSGERWLRKNLARQTRGVLRISAGTSARPLTLALSTCGEIRAESPLLDGLAFRVLGESAPWEFSGDLHLSAELVQ